MAIHSQAAEQLEQYIVQVERVGGPSKCLIVPEGAYSGWLPRVLYKHSLESLYLPFLRLLSFPVGGTSLGCLTSLRIFSAVGNYLHHLPDCFVSCSDIVSLDLSFNHFITIPKAVFSLSKLEELNFSHNDIEEVSSEIGKLTNLHVLNLAGNALDYVPLDLAKCRHIQKLDLSGKFYPRGQIRNFPEAVCFLFELTELDLSWQRIERIPDEFGNLKQLQKLNLKGNHLLHVSQEISKCVRLQSVNLSGALRYCGKIPEALFTLEDLQSLNLSDNFFTEIPEEVCELSHLRVLNMQRNALLRLPDSLFQLWHLEHLELSENYLEKLPDTIGNARRLTYLGLERNRLKELPSQLCQVKSLVFLILGSNQLTSLPENISQLVGLRELLLENNKLTELPLLLDRLTDLIETGGLSLHGNYLRTPPQEICDQGVVPLFHFLKELRVSEARHRRKMILIGAVKAGKTSLRHALMLGRSQLTTEHERTWVLERHLWEPESMLRVQILDFGGHHIYQAAHHMFLTPDALHVLVFDLNQFHLEKYDDLISNWLDAIMDRAPGASIMLVGTHADLCSQDEIKERREAVLRRMKKEESLKLRDLTEEIDRVRTLLERPDIGGGKFADIDVERLQEKLSHLEKMLNTRSKLPGIVHVVSCAEGLLGVDTLRENLLTVLKETEERPLPQTWYRFLCDIQANSNYILPLETALDIFKSVMTSYNQSMMGMGGSAQLSLSMVLKYLHTTGEIVWYWENPRLHKIIFHRPETLIEMLRAVFRHDFESVVNFDKELGMRVDLNESRFQMFKDFFVNQGLMTYDLLYFTLLQFKLSADVLDIFISLMLRFDLCYELKEEIDPSLAGCACILQFPWFFTQERPECLARDWPEKIPINTFELQFQLEFPRKGPPHFFEKLSVRLQAHVSNRINWKHGVLARKNRSLLLVTREWQKVKGITVIKVAARSSSDLQELWWLLKQTRTEMLQLLMDWPFAQFTMSLMCSHCLLRGLDDPYHFPGDVMDRSMPRNTYMARWCRKHINDDVPACFVYALDLEHQDNLGKHMQAAADFLQSCFDTVDGPGLLSDTGLMFIASRLGFDWIRIVTQLGLRNERVQQIQMTHRDIYQQIFTGLQDWRDQNSNNNNNNTTGGAIGDGDNLDSGQRKKIQDLLTVLSSDGIERMDLVQEIEAKYCVSLENSC